MPDVTLRWVAALDADVDTDYRVDGDQGTVGTFITVATRNSTNRGDGSYEPFTTTLNGALAVADTTVVLTSGTDFDAGDFVVVDGETILLGTKSTNTFSGCTRGVGGSVPAAHDSGTAVYAAHESYTFTPTWNAERHVIRYRIVRVQGSDESIAAEFTAINPPAPPDSAYCTVYGVEVDSEGGPLADVDVSMVVNETDGYQHDTGEKTVKGSAQPATSGEDGFWSFACLRTKVTGGAVTYTITVGAGGDVNTWLVDVVPDADAAFVGNT